MATALFAKYGKLLAHETNKDKTPIIESGKIQMTSWYFPKCMQFSQKPVRRAFK